jgi:hypothetical protein
MLAKRGCQPLVYPQNRTNATGEPSNFASSLIFLLLTRMPEKAGLESEVTTLRGKIPFYQNSISMRLDPPVLLCEHIYNVRKKASKGVNGVAVQI